MTQPPPQANDNPYIADLVIEEFLEIKDPIVEVTVEYLKNRKIMGYKKYGKYLQAHNGRNTLEDIRDEICDTIMYCRQAMEEGIRDIELFYKLAIVNLLYIQRMISRRH